MPSKSKSSSSDSDEISDEEEDLKNYLKRRESRKYFNFNCELKWVIIIMLLFQ